MTTFDAERYKATTRVQWDDAAEAWYRWHPTLETWLREATDAMLDMAKVGEGDRVLDIAAGAGQQTLDAARRVGPTGSVLATDLSPQLVRFAQDAAEAAGLTNVQTRVMDAEDLDLPANSFDAIICRLGLMFLPNLPRALTGVRRVLKPGGHLAAVVISTPDKNPFSSIAGGVIFQKSGLPAPVPDQPGPYRLGAPGALEEAFEAAGFRDVTARAIDAPLRTATAADCARFQREAFAGMDQMMFKLDRDQRDEVWREVAERLTVFEGPGGFVGPGELLVGSGVK